MPITIGAKKEADFSDPIGLLGDCHRRIERFLDLLVMVANRAEGAALNTDERDALEASLRYFRLSAPRHTLDEEESLFPQLRDSQDPRVEPVLSLLQRLSGDHRLAEEKHSQVEELVNRWLSDDGLSLEGRCRLRQVLAELSEFYATHIAIEEEQVFPLASSVLTTSALQLIGREMAERRGVAARRLDEGCREGGDPDASKRDLPG